MDKQKVKLLEHCYTMILSINATFMRLELKNFNPLIRDFRLNYPKNLY
ncbi:hypothetical protein L932_04720 [Helicobacter pylori PZ5026]|nr:hypothetical protein [Helicobacter pylori]EQD93339.1 hypothetical protein L932_04720 [Helicobacter pylori PZ5026]